MNRSIYSRQFCWQDTQFINIIQGEYSISDDPQAVIRTVLGSCVAACITDIVAGIGGMNHFLLPGTQKTQKHRLDDTLYGVNLMRQLIDGLLARGARIENMEAQIFGGANTLTVPGNIGELNARFAEDYLGERRIRVIGGSIGGQEARKLAFSPVSGESREIRIAGRRA